MSLESLLLDRLEADATVGGIVGKRLYHEWRAQGIKKASVVVTRISGFHEYGLSTSNRFNRSRFQFDCFDTTFEKTRTLADAVIAELISISGTLGSFSIESVSLQNELSLGEQDGDNTIRRISLDFVVVYL